MVTRSKTCNNQPQNETPKNVVRIADDNRSRIQNCKKRTVSENLDSFENQQAELTCKYEYGDNNFEIESDSSSGFPTVNQWVLAFFEEKKRFKLARIIGWKLIGTNVTHLTHLAEKKTGNNSSTLIKVNSSTNESKLIEDYEFYVHFRGLNRRLDRWIRGKDIKLAYSIDELDDPVLYDRFQRQGINHISFLGTSNSTTKSNNRSKKRNISNLEISDGEDPEEHEGMDHSALLDHEETTRLRTIDRVRIGKFILNTWYFSPFPDEYQNVDTLHFCEYCLEFFCYEQELIRHLSGCLLRHPPGNEIYRKDNISIFEIDGALTREYAENLCYLAKLFLDHKTLQYDVEPFLFYIVTEVDEEGCHIVGYFSKEKVSLLHYNLACILTLPCYQRKGYGKLLVDLSYKLSLKEGKWGHPERPLSDLGRSIYNNWWTNRIFSYLVKNFNKSPGFNLDSRQSAEELNYGKFIDSIVRSTSIRKEDVIKVLEDNGIIRSIKDRIYIYCDHDFLKKMVGHSEKSGCTLLEKNFSWVPFNRLPPSEEEALPPE